MPAEPDPLPDWEVHPGAEQVRRRDRKFWIAMGLFAVLAVVIWFSFGEGRVYVFGKEVPLRVIPLVVVGTFVFRTYMAREADKVRRSSRK